MAADQERADRIRALKRSRPDLTWRRIAEHVGVTERSASDWQTKGGIEYANAEKLAALFDVNVDYIWRGDGESSPSPFSSQDEYQDQLELIAGQLQRFDPDQLDRIELRLNQIHELLTGERDPVAEHHRGIVEGDRPGGPQDPPRAH